MAWTILLSGIALGTLLVFGAFGSIVWFVDPESAGKAEWALVLLTVFLGFVGCFLLLSLGFSSLFFGRERALVFLGSIFRRSVLLSLFFSFLFLLFLFQFLVWWNALFGLAFFLLIEMWFVRRSKEKKTGEPL